MGKTSTLTRIIEVIAGVCLMIFVAYSIYICATNEVELPMLEFMICCNAIIFVGFGVATLVELAIGKIHHRVDIRPLFEPMRGGLLLIVIISLVCGIISII